jgi:hypothetical protein
MRIGIVVPHVFTPSSDSLEDAIVLRALLECLTDINTVYLKRHQTPPLYAAGVSYQRTDNDNWLTIPAVMQLGFADCKSLTAWRLAELRLLNHKAHAVFRWQQRSNGAKDFHILIQDGGKYEDPSRILGMGGGMPVQRVQKRTWLDKILGG